MKKIIFLVYLIIGISFVFAQNETDINKEAIIDSSLVKSNLESSITVADSLADDSENSILIDSEGSYEISKKDSLEDTRIELKTKMDNFILENNKFVPLTFYYQENFHIKTANEPDVLIIKNGFTLHNSKLKNGLLIQTHFPFYQSHYENNLILMNNSNYNLIVPITVTYLGLGDEEMNQAFLSYKKGSIFNIKNLNIETSYLGNSGNWYGVNEKTKNFDLHLFYNSKFGELHFYHTTINQEISSSRFDIKTDKLVISDKLLENSVVFQTKLFDLGIKTTTSKIDTLQYKFEQFYLSKNIYYQKHSLKTTLEQFTGDLDYSSITAFHKSQFRNLVIHNSGFYRTNKNHYLASGVDLDYNKFEIGAEFISSDMLDKYYKYLGKVGMNLNNFDIELKIGEKYETSDKWYFTESFSKIIVPTNFTNFILQNRTEYLFDAPQEFPKLTSTTSFKLQFDFKYDNCIKTGLTHTYYSDYTDSIDIYNANNLDAFFNIQITKYFEFYLNAINILNNRNMFKQLNSVPQSHIIYGMKWVFVN